MKSFAIGGPCAVSHIKKILDILRDEYKLKRLTQEDSYTKQENTFAVFGTVGTDKFKDVEMPVIYCDTDPKRPAACYYDYRIVTNDGDLRDEVCSALTETGVF